MKKGFTLIELLVYIVLMAIILNISIYFVWQIISMKAKTTAYLEVEKNLTLTLEKISYETKRAKSLEIPQLQDQETKELILKKADGSLVHFYLQNNRLVLRTSRDLSRDPTREVARDFSITPSVDPSAPLFITNERVRISELVFHKVSSAIPGALQIKIKMNYYNPTQRSEHQAEIAIQKTITLRDQGMALSVIEPVSELDF